MLAAHRRLKKGLRWTHYNILKTEGPVTCTGPFMSTDAALIPVPDAQRVPVLYSMTGLPDYQVRA